MKTIREIALRKAETLRRQPLSELDDVFLQHLPDGPGVAKVVSFELTVWLSSKVDLRTELGKLYRRGQRFGWRSRVAALTPLDRTEVPAIKDLLDTEFSLRDTGSGRADHNPGASRPHEQLMHGYR